MNDARHPPPPERHRAADAVQRLSVQAAWNIGEVLGDADQPIVVDTRRHVSLDAVDRLITGALEDNARVLRDVAGDDEAP